MIIIINIYLINTKNKEDKIKNLYNYIIFKYQVINIDSYILIILKLARYFNKCLFSVLLLQTMQ